MSMYVCAMMTMTIKKVMHPLIIGPTWIQSMLHLRI